MNTLMKLGLAAVSAGLAAALLAGCDDKRSPLDKGVTMPQTIS